MRIFMMLVCLVATIVGPFGAGYLVQSAATTGVAIGVVGTGILIGLLGLYGFGAGILMSAMVIDDRTVVVDEWKV